MSALKFQGRLYGGYVMILALRGSWDLTDSKKEERPPRAWDEDNLWSLRQPKVGLMNKEHWIRRRDTDLKPSLKEAQWKHLTCVGVRADFGLAHNYMVKQAEFSFGDFPTWHFWLSFPFSITPSKDSTILLMLTYLGRKWVTNDPIHTQGFLT